MSIINQIRRKSILVIGDIMLDTYFMGSVKRISPEAPVPVFKKKSERYALGGAANVAANLVAANQKVSVMSFVGDDEAGEILCSSLKAKDIAVDLLWSLPRKTTIKTRFLADNNQQVLRLDVEDVSPLDYLACRDMLTKLEQVISEYDLIVVSDYLKGLLTYDFTQGIVRMGAKYNIPVIVDVKDPNIKKYCNAFLLKPNLNEIRSLTGMPAQTDQEIVEAAEKLRVLCNTQYVLCTCGGRGMVLVGDNMPPFFIQAENREVFDVSGAGDTTIAYLSACLANQLHIEKAVTIANIAAGIQVGKLGTSVVALDEVIDYMKDESEGHLKKVLSNSGIATFRQNFSGKKIVFTNGCFDILHVGHIRYLHEAAKLGDILVVGVNSDSSVKRLKGDGRPVNSEQDRMELLCALKCVDFVALFSEDTPYDLIKQIQPDVLVKGGDYNIENIVGRDIVESRGGIVKTIGYVEGKSTTNILEKLYME